MTELILSRNDARRENGKVYLTLSNGHCVVVDESDYESVKNYRWTAVQKTGGGWYARAAIADGKGKQRWVLMHREILGLTKGDGKEADHKDRDGLNNTRENLRLATSSQNNRNRRKRSGLSSEFRGVCWQKKYPPKPWQSSIRVDGGRRIFLGYFATEREAAEAYNKAAILHHGAFANLNEL